MLTLGIDEAGRGPIIESMFVVGTMFEEKNLDKLKQIGIKDSKLIPHHKLIRLTKEIKKLAKSIEIIEVKPKEIDEAIDGNNSLNLNWLEALKICKIINKLKPDKAIIDCPSPNIEVYTDFVKKHINENILKKVELIVKHKADRDFVECASASVVAKTMREENVKKIEKNVKESIGSGYPANPVCQAFIKSNYKKYPDIFRKSWGTYKKIAKEKKQKSLADF